jgi:hypothetical protein
MRYSDFIVGFARLKPPPSVVVMFEGFACLKLLKSLVWH